MLSVRLLRSTAITPLLCYCEPLRIPARAAVRLLFPLPRCLSCLARPAGLPRFLDWSVHARCSQPPRKVQRVLACCFPTGFRHSS